MKDIDTGDPVPSSFGQKTAQFHLERLATALSLLDKAEINARHWHTSLRQNFIDVNNALGGLYCILWPTKMVHGLDRLECSRLATSTRNSSCSSRTCLVSQW